MKKQNITTSYMKGIFTHLHNFMDIAENVLDFDAYSLYGC